MSISGFLTSHDLFKMMSREELSRVSELSSEKLFKQGETIYRKDSVTSHFFLVIEGTVSLQLPCANDRHGFAVSKVEKGELFGLSPVLGYGRYTVRAVAKSDVTVLAIEVKPFLALLKSSPTVTDHVVSSVARSFYSRYLTLLETLQGIVAQLTTPH